MPRRPPLQPGELENEARALRATLVMLEQLARSDFERLRHYLEGLDRRLQALEAQLLAQGGETQSDTSATVEDRQPVANNSNGHHGVG